MQPCLQLRLGLHEARVHCGGASGSGGHSDPHSRDLGSAGMVASGKAPRGHRWQTQCLGGSGLMQ